MKGMWVGYDVGCTMGLTCGHGAWQIDRQSNGSMWNSYSFQPVGQWMSYSFTDLGAEGCCRSLNALLSRCITGTVGLINMEWKGYESIGCYMYYVTMSLTLTLDFHGQIFKKLYHRNKRVDWHGTKRMWVDRMLDPSCDFKLWPHPWPWPWIFKVKFLIAIF